MAVIIETPSVFGSQPVRPAPATPTPVRPAAPQASRTPAVNSAAVQRALTAAGISMVTQEACSLSQLQLEQRTGYRPNSLAINYGSMIWNACHPQPTPQAVPPGILGTMPQPGTPGQPPTPGGSVTIRPKPGGGQTIIVPGGQNFIGPGVNVQRNTGNGSIVIQK